MQTRFNYKKFIQQLCSLGERQLRNETKALKLITSLLKKSKVNYNLQEFITYIPNYKSWSLTVDKKKIDCKPSGLVSGKIENNFSLISNLTSSQDFFYKPNINFNPVSKSVSRSNHYFATALSVKYSDLQKICKSKKIIGELVVEKSKHISANILVGNLINPRNIIFCHYDSIGTGSVDNASGVALSLDLIINSPSILKDTLFVIAGNEELSYDQTIYWGHGYRVFEKKYGSLIEKARKIIVLDSFGFSEPVKYTDPKIVVLGFPIKKINKYKNKITMISGDIKKLMPFYHTDDDKPELIKTKYFQSTKKLCIRLLT